MNDQKIAILADSGCDIPLDVAKKNDIRIIPLRVMYPEKDYDDGINIDPVMVYRRFPDEIPTTSTPSLAEIQDILDEVKEEGYEKVIALTISSGLSGTFNSVRLAASQQDDLDVFPFDTKNISIASGLLALWAASKIRNGWSFEEIKAGLQNKIGDSKVMFYMDTLKYLKRGGRIGTVSSALGEALHLKPIISCNEEGIYYTVSLIRGAKQAKKKLLGEIAKFCEGHHVWITIGHGDANEEAGKTLSLVETQIKSKELLFVKQINATLAINTGPGLIGIAVLLDP